MKIKSFFAYAFLLLVAAGSQPAIGAFWQWSKTSSLNAGADPSINWAEGMSPSSVNDSARAMMARAAEYRDDISGALALAGTSTAYTLTTNQGLCQAPASTTTPVTGQMLAFVPNVTNGSAPGLTVDSCNSFPLQVSAGSALPAGTIVAGTPYRASFSGTAWVMEAGYGSPYAVPLGGLMYSTVATPPNSNFILPAGQCLSSTTYATYFAALGSPASGTCPGGQFPAIDMRGRFPIALDNLNGTPANRVTAAGCGSALTSVGVACTGTETMSLLATNIPALTSTNASQSINVYANGNSSLHVPAVTTSWQPVSTGTGSSVGALTTSSVNPVDANAFQGFNSISVTSTGTNGTAFTRLGPSVGVTVFLRVL